MHFLSMCLEVINGFRPAVHLRRLAEHSKFETITDQLARAQARMTVSPPRSRVRLRRLVVCEPRPGVAEAAAVVGHGDTVWAMAMRLEQHQAGWLCTAAQVV